MIGFVYIAVNPSFDQFLKVGKTGTDPETRRIEELFTTGVPDPFTLIFSALSDDYHNLETRIHRHFGETRVNPNREFFDAPLIDVINYIISDKSVVLKGCRFYEGTQYLLQSLNSTDFHLSEAKYWKKDPKGNLKSKFGEIARVTRKSGTQLLYYSNKNADVELYARIRKNQVKGPAVCSTHQNAGIRSRTLQILCPVCFSNISNVHPSDVKNKYHLNWEVFKVYWQGVEGGGVNEVVKAPINEVLSQNKKYPFTTSGYPLKKLLNHTDYCTVESFCEACDTLLTRASEPFCEESEKFNIRFTLDCPDSKKIAYSIARGPIMTILDNPDDFFDQFDLNPDKDLAE